MGLMLPDCWRAEDEFEEIRAEAVRELSRQRKALPAPEEDTIISAASEWHGPKQSLCKFLKKQSVAQRICG
jgi:hypothetical protein